MTTFIELLPETVLLERTTNYARVIIVGCRECANISFAYSYALPLFTPSFHFGPGAWEPSAAMTVMGKVNALLQKAGKHVTCELESACLLWPEKEFFMSAHRTDCDAVLSVSCLAGQVGITKAVGGGIPVISGATTVGLLQPWMELDKSNVVINREKSTLIRFPYPLPETVDLSQYWHAANKS